MQAQPLLAHLQELRRRLLLIFATLLVIFCPLAYFAKPIYSALAAPVLALLPVDSMLITTQIAAPFLVPLKLSLWLAILLAAPVILYQLWAFVAPALYRHERRYLLPLLVVSCLLFYAGVLFAWFVVLKLALNFLIHFAPAGVQVMTDAGSYVDFILWMSIAFGAAFELPVAVVVLVLTGAVSVASLRANRAYMLIGAFVVGMLLTPPDVISQTLLALPLICLYELGILIAVILSAPAKRAPRQS